MVRAKYLVVDYRYYVIVGEFESVAGKQNDGIHNQYAGNHPWNGHSLHQQGYESSSSVADGQSWHYTEDAYMVEVKHRFQECGFGKHAPEE